MTRLLAGERVAVDVTVELRSSVQGLLLLFSGVTSLVLLILAVLWGVRHFWGHLQNRAISLCDRPRQPWSPRAAAGRSRVNHFLEITFRDRKTVAKAW
jgi:hypothetical protein